MHAKTQTPILMCAMLLGAAARADLLPADESAFVLQSSILDAEAFLLSEFFDPSAMGVLDFEGTAEQSGAWQSTFSGTLFGQPLAITYSGSAGSFPDDPLQWTGTGSFGAHDWTSEGGGRFIATPDGFDIIYLSTVAMGVHEAVFDCTIHAAGTPDSFEFGQTEGTITLDGAAYLDIGRFTFRGAKSGNVLAGINDFHWWGQTRVISRGAIITGSFNGTITIPAPGAPLMMLALPVLYPRRRR